MKLKRILILSIAVGATLLASVMADAQSLSSEISKAAKRHKVDPVLLALIVQIESSGLQSAVNHKTRDYGVGQINERSAKLWGLDIKRLKMDRAYNLDAAALILADAQKRYSNREPLTWPCRYNIGSGTLKSKAGLCAKYLGRLNRAAMVSKIKTPMTVTPVIFKENIKRVNRPI